jgi:hypothetical protein
MKKGSKQTPEAIERMRQAKLGKRDSPETIEKKRLAQLSPETLEKNRLFHKGKKDSPETLEKKRLSHLGERNGFYGRRHSSETLELMKRPKTDLHKQHLSESKAGIAPANIDSFKISRVGSTNSDYQKQCARDYNTGLVRSEETKQKVSENRTGLCCGEDNPSWKGGVTPLIDLVRGSPNYCKWRETIFKRDNYADVITGESGASNVLNVHHIVSFADIWSRNNITTYEEALACEELWDISNGITLTEKNHMKLHTKSQESE